MAAAANDKTIGGYLQDLRTVRRMGLATLARRSGVHRATLHRWERGETLPRLPELGSVLRTLGVGAREQRQVWRLIDAPRAQERVREETARIAAALAIGPVPRAGDLLRAMRNRRCLSLEEVATRVGVTTRTLRLWEKTEVWPKLEILHRLCYVLKANEEEIVALTVGDFASLPIPEATSLEALEARILAVRALGRGAIEERLKELHYLALEAEAWPLAAQSVAGRCLLARAYAYHADYLSDRDRFLEAQQFAERTLDLLAEKFPSDQFWLYAGIASARSVVFRGAHSAPKRGLDALHHWLPVAKWPEFEAWILADMAKYEALHRDIEGALALAERACRTAERCDNPGERNLREIDKARLLLQAGRSGEALALLLVHEGRFYGINRIDADLLNAEAYLEMGALSEAHDWLQRALAEIERDDLPHLRSRAAALAQRF